jgi:hypothetical protein
VYRGSEVGLDGENASPKGDDTDLDLDDGEDDADAAEKDHLSAAVADGEETDHDEEDEAPGAVGLGRATERNTFLPHLPFIGIDYELGPQPTDPQPETQALSESQSLAVRHFLRWHKTHGTTQAYEEHAKTLRELGHDVPALNQMRSYAAELVGLERQELDMCRNSCIAFLGPFKDAETCHVCYAERYAPQRGRAARKAARRFTYIPFTPRVRALFADQFAADELRYRHTKLEQALDVVNEDSRVFDDFPDGEAMREAMHGEGLAERDCLFLASTDGAQVFAQRQSDAWLVMAQLLNIPPTAGRVQLSRSFLLAIIPGPKAPEDIESYLWVFYEEFRRAERGVWFWDASRREWFEWHAHLFGFGGDMPASQKINGCTGHHGKCGCRFCHMVGARVPGRKGYYFSLATVRELDVDGDPSDLNCARPKQYDPLALPLRTHPHWLATVQRLDALDEAEREKASTESGIVEAPLASALKLFRFPSFFPIDISHLIYLNVVPNLWDLLRRDGKSKAHPDDLDHFDDAMAGQIGAWVTAAAGTLPSLFGNAPRNIAEKRHSQFKMWEWAAYFHWYLVRVRARHLRWTASSDAASYQVFSFSRSTRTSSSSLRSFSRPSSCSVGRAASPGVTLTAHASSSPTLRATSRRASSETTPCWSSVAKSRCTCCCTCQTTPSGWGRSGTTASSRSSAPSAPSSSSSALTSSRTSTLRPSFGTTHSPPVSRASPPFLPRLRRSQRPPTPAATASSSCSLVSRLVRPSVSDRRNGTILSIARRSASASAGHPTTTLSSSRLG